jgi:1-acyl-sn-glycerol-3-phosphate acyltransferase
MFRLRVTGLGHVPSGGVVVASNQLSNVDGIAIAYALYPRPVRWMGKAELFHALTTPLLRRLGIFPVRRGEGDADALATAVALTRDGHAVGIFPEEPAARRDSERSRSRDRTAEPRA